MTRQMDFWARRRAAVKAEEEADARARADALSAEQAVAQAEKDDGEILAELGLPDPDQMQAGDDFAAFLQKGVPEHLRRTALRKLWRSNPVLACVDGLNEYDDDYRAAMLLQGPVQTAYQVGKGMLKHVEEMARKAEADSLQQPEETPGADDPLEAEEVAMADTVEQSEADVERNAEPLADHGAGPTEVHVMARRMRFRFEEATA